MIAITLNSASTMLKKNTSLDELVTALNLQGKRIAIEQNGIIISRSNYAKTRISEHDCIEIIHAVGGG